MLYRPVPLNFEREVLVFVHIPKTAGSALDDALKQHLGDENCLLTRAENIGQIFPDRFRKLHWKLRKFLRESPLRQRRAHPLLPDGFSAERLGRILLLDGHFSLGNEPKTSREPVYLTLLREPVDRFLSEYYYRFDVRAEWPEGQRERHAYRTYEVDQFVDYVYRRRSWCETNLQCRYIGGVGDFAAAKEAIDRRIFLAAPSTRIDECLELLQPVLDLKTTRAPIVNVGLARQVRASPSKETLAKIREMVSQDQLLYDYASRAFDDLSRAMSRERLAG